jgi:hypothetical protein
VNQAAIEIARILLEFEIYRIKTAAAFQTLAGENAATVADQPQKANRQLDSTPKPGNGKKSKNEHR